MAFLMLCCGAVIINQRDTYIKEETDLPSGPFGAVRTPLLIQPADHLLFAFRRKRKGDRTFQIVRGAGEIIRTGPDSDTEDVAFILALGFLDEVTHSLITAGKFFLFIKVHIQNIIILNHDGAAFFL